MSEAAPGKAGITRADIETLLAAFYTAVRADPRLGPVFHAHVGTSDADWAPHLAKIADFWANVMLQERAYQGNPMQVHLAMPEIEPADFARWLDLFEATATRLLPPLKAQTFDLLARRIGRSLVMGIETTRARRTGAPPRL